MSTEEQRARNAEAQRRWRAAHPEHKERQKKYMRTWINDNPEQRRKQRDDARARNREFLAQAKDKPCMDCGNSFPKCVMEFDHVRGEKLDGVGTMAGHNFSLELLKAEIAKCDLVCANCHRIRTWKRGTYDEMARTRRAA